MDHIQLIKNGEENRFYKLQIWRRKRLEALARDNNECQICKYRVRDKIVRATHVHHIKELKIHPELSLDIDNLICLCNACHELQHDRNINTRVKPKFSNEERW